MVYSQNGFTTKERRILEFSFNSSQRIYLKIIERDRETDKRRIYMFIYGSCFLPTEPEIIE